MIHITITAVLVRWSFSNTGTVVVHDWYWCDDTHSAVQLVRGGGRHSLSQIIASHHDAVFHPLLAHRTILGVLLLLLDLLHLLLHLRRRQIAFSSGYSFFPNLAESQIWQNRGWKCSWVRYLNHPSLLPNTVWQTGTLRCNSIVSHHIVCGLSVHSLWTSQGTFSSSFMCCVLPAAGNGSTEQLTQ